jgi:hypothetical protein
MLSVDNKHKKTKIILIIIIITSELAGNFMENKTILPV